MSEHHFKLSGEYGEIEVGLFSDDCDISSTWLNGDGNVLSFNSISLEKSHAIEIAEKILRFYNNDMVQETLPL